MIDCLLINPDNDCHIFLEEFEVKSSRCDLVSKSSQLLGMAKE